MDFENIPFADFLENVIPWLVGMDAKRIAIAAINENDAIGCAYFQCEPIDKDILADAIKFDAYEERVSKNIRHFRKLAEADKQQEDNEDDNGE